jgi:quercetin dioxygenase-like cupin family protein
MPAGFFLFNPRYYILCKMTSLAGYVRYNKISWIKGDYMGNDDIIGCVAALDGLIDYQVGAVVSRAVIDKPAGTVTLFAFDKGQGLSEHTAPYDAMVDVIDGEVEITISGKPSRVKQGEIFIMPANEPHALKALARFKMMLVMIKS